MKKKIAVGAVLIALLLVGGGLWYTRPVTIQQLRPELDLDACYAITAYSSTGFGIEMDSVTLGPDDPLFQPLLTELQGQTFSRSIDNILPFELPSFSLSDLLAGLLHLDEYMTYIRSPDPDLFEWELHLEFASARISDGQTPAGQSLLICYNNYTAELEIDNNTGGTWLVSTPDETDWPIQILELVSPDPMPSSYLINPRY